MSFLKVRMPEKDTIEINPDISKLFSQEKSKPAIIIALVSNKMDQLETLIRHFIPSINSELPSELSLFS